MTISSVARAVAGLGAVALTFGLHSAPAQADPPPGVCGVLAGSGAGTTQDVMQAVADASGGLMESWASHGSSPINPKCLTDENGDPILVTRPNGASEGRDALRRSRGTNVNTSGWDQGLPVPLGSDVFDFARSSAGPGTNQNNNGQLVYIPFVRGAMGVATGPTSTLPGFTLAQLRTLYRDGLSVTVGGTTYTPDGNVTLLISQPGSGTRAFFANVMGINANVLPAWVHDAVDGVPVQEDDGAALEFDPTAMRPFWVPQWITQDSGLVPDQLHGAQLKPVDGISPIQFNPATGLNEANPAYSDALEQDAYNIVAHDEAITPGSDIQWGFVGGSSLTCSSQTEFPPGSGNFVPTIELYGFATHSNCGAVLDSLRAFVNG